MRIGELAAEAGVSAQTLRYYERRGLLAEHARMPSGYRSYGASAVREVRFIRRAQDLGFTLDEIGGLLSLWADSAKSCATVESRASETLARIDGKIADLRQMREALSKYVSACRNERRFSGVRCSTNSGETLASRNSSVRIDLVYDRDCPNIERAQAMIRAALEQIGSPTSWTEWDRDDVRTPRDLRRYGSPTVLVNGRDVGCDENEDTRPDANSCRIYIDECGCVCGAPSSALIVRAIRGALAA